MEKEEKGGVVNSATDEKIILIVENEALNSKLVESFLKNTYAYETVEDGHSAIEKSKNKKYSMILMDINLGKGMSGLEAAMEIRKIDGYLEVPIIAMTAFAMKGDEKEFLSGGCTDYIAKPFIQRDLLVLVSKYSGTD
ncbi:MAG: response regulator [Ignavibacteriota bacterium]|nr:response regulator [Ignavibacteriota bacterium]